MGTGLAGQSVRASGRIAASSDFEDPSYLAIGRDGTLWAWGCNHSGQLGLGDCVDRETPERIGEDGDWRDVACGDRYSMALKRDGTLWAWGRRTRPGTQAHLFAEKGLVVDCLSLGDCMGRLRPHRVGSDSDWQHVACGDGHTLALKRNGHLWGWGSNLHGQVGLGHPWKCDKPERIGELVSAWGTVACGSQHSVALARDGSLWCWGDKDIDRRFVDKARTGVGLELDSLPLRPQQVGTQRDWRAVACGFEHSLALKSDGSLWAWGSNTSGQLGLGDSDERLQPERVGADRDWEMVSCGGLHSLAIKRDSSLWGWGADWSGQLGPVDSYGTDRPQQLGRDRDWRAVAGGGWDTLAVKVDGALWVFREDVPQRPIRLSKA